MLLVISTSEHCFTTVVRSSPPMSVEKGHFGHSLQSGAPLRWVGMVYKEGTARTMAPSRCLLPRRH